MFGYVRICREELDEENFQRFREYYCGLCKEIGRYSNVARMGLSYDMTFLLILLSAVCDENSETQSCRCMLHPLKRECAVKHNTTLDYVANMSILLSYRKIEDDWIDDHSAKAFIGKLLYTHSFKKIKKQYSVQDSAISFQLSRLSKLEKENCSDSDEVADCFAKICETVFTPDFITDTNLRKILSWIGYNTGRWIYLIDAFDDLKKDIKNKVYNPFIPKINEKKYKIKDLAEEIEVTLTYTLANIAAAYDFLDIKCNDIILKNILYTGMEGMQRKVLNIQEEADGSI